MRCLRASRKVIEGGHNGERGPRYTPGAAHSSAMLKGTRAGMGQPELYTQHPLWNLWERADRNWHGSLEGESSGWIQQAIDSV